MKRYQQLLILPAIAFSFMACMQSNKKDQVTVETTEPQNNNSRYYH